MLRSAPPRESAAPASVPAGGPPRSALPWDLAVVAALVLGSAAFAALYGWRDHLALPDEFYSVQGARLFFREPLDTLVDTSVLNRGVERLLPLLLAVPLGATPDTPAGFQAAHVVAAAVHGLVALPVWALARGLGLARWACATAAAVAVLVPWILYGATLLNTPLGTLTLALFVLAAWHAVVRPSPWGDAVALGAGVLTAGARAGHAVFLAVLVVAVVVQTWRARPAGGIGPALLQLPGRVARRHPVVAAATVVGVLVLLVLGFGDVVGAAYSSAAPDALAPGDLLRRAGQCLAELDLGTGYVPLIVALPWVLREAVAPRRPQTGAFAVIALCSFVLFVASTVQAPDEERYVAVLAPLVAVAFATAVAVRDVPLWAVALSWVVVARAVVTGGRYEADDPFASFIAPARHFFTKVVEGRLSTVVPDALPLPTIAMGVAGAAALALVAARRSWGSRRAGGVVATVVIGGTLGVATASAIYETERFSEQAQREELELGRLAFADAATDRRPAALLDVNPTGDAGIVAEYESAFFFNASLRSTVRPEAALASFRCCPGIGPLGGEVDLRADPRTGAASASGPVPDFLVVRPGFQATGLATGVVATQRGVGTAVLPWRVEEIRRPLRLSYAARGLTREGFLRPGRTASIRVFPRAGGGPRCLQAVVGPAPTARRPARFAFTGGREPTRGSVAPGAPVGVNVRVGEGRRPVTIRLRAQGEASGLTGVGGSAVLGLGDLVVMPC